MNPKPTMLCITLLIGSTVTLAGAEPLNGDSDYRKALPYIEKVTQLITKIDKRRELGLPPKEATAPYLKELKDNIKKSAFQLNKAAEQQHPVALYQLAKILDLHGSEQEKSLVCEFLNSSLSQGFAPAAIEMATLCPNLANTTDFLVRAEESARSPGYSEYFPQRSHFLNYCERRKTRTLNAAKGSQAEYQAAIYYLLGSKSEKPKSNEYFRLAAEKGCSNAQQRLRRISQSN